MTAGVRGRAGKQETANDTLERWGKALERHEEILEEIRRLGPAILKSLRREKGWSQEVLADRLDTGRMHLSAIERGVHMLSFEMIRKLRDLFSSTP